MSTKDYSVIRFADQAIYISRSKWIYEKENNLYFYFPDGDSFCIKNILSSCPEPDQKNWPSYAVEKIIRENGKF